VLAALIAAVVSLSAVVYTQWQNKKRDAKIDAGVSSVEKQRIEAAAYARSEDSNQRALDTALAHIKSLRERVEQLEEYARHADIRATAIEARAQRAEIRADVAEDRARAAERRAQVAEKIAEAAEKRAEEIEARARRAEGRAERTEVRADAIEERADRDEVRADAADLRADRAENGTPEDKP
jgi:uncharacterized protein (DUF3084 family)